MTCARTANSRSTACFAWADGCGPIRCRAWSPRRRGSAGARRQAQARRSVDDHMVEQAGRLVDQPADRGRRTSSSAGLGGICPAQQRQIGLAVSWMKLLSSPLPVSRLLSPEPSARPNDLCSDGLRMSASISSTREPVRTKPERERRATSSTCPPWPGRWSASATAECRAESRIGATSGSRNRPRTAATAVRRSASRTSVGAGSLGVTPSSGMPSLRWKSRGSSSRILEMLEDDRQPRHRTQAEDQDRARC